MDIIIRYLLVILVVVCVVFPSISYGGDYLSGLPPKLRSEWVIKG